MTTLVLQGFFRTYMVWRSLARELEAEKFAADHYEITPPQADGLVRYGLGQGPLDVTTHETPLPITHEVTVPEGTAEFFDRYQERLMALPENHTTKEISKFLLAEAERLVQGKPVKKGRIVPLEGSLKLTTFGRKVWNGRDQ